MLSTTLLIVWISLGKIMGYGNDNWWLIIGAYTGLVSPHGVAEYAFWLIREPHSILPPAILHLSALCPGTCCLQTAATSEEHTVDGWALST